MCKYTHTPFTYHTYYTHTTHTIYTTHAYTHPQASIHTHTHPCNTGPASSVAKGFDLGALLNLVSLSFYLHSQFQLSAL